MTARRLDPGSVVSGKYKVLERLGGGGMGDVYRAEHVLAGRVVALKLLRADFAEDEDLTRRFFQEAQAVNRIRHPNIVDVLDAGFSEEGPYVVMECLEGTSMSAALARVGRLDVATAVSTILPVLDALDAAHRHGIIHRDLKPENIFVARGSHDSRASHGGRDDVRMKILDFGIAKVLDSGDATARPQTHTGVIFGTPDYLSPEQASGEGTVDGRSDLFAIAIVLFELVTGKKPFEAKNAIATAYRIVHEPTPRLSTFGITADALQAALDVALAKRPGDRFATAAAFAEALAPLVGDASSGDLLATLLDSALAQPVRSSGVAPRAPDPPSPLAPTELVMRASSPAPPPVRPSRPVPTSSRRMLTTTTPHPSWTPRPLPAHVKGRCHARGTFPRAVFRWLERAYGRDALDAVLDVLPREHADDFRNDAFNSLVWHELEPVDMLMEAATSMILGGDAARWRILARENFANDLGTILRPSSRLVDAQKLLERSATGWSRIFDFGKVRLGDANAGRILLAVDGFEAASLPIRWAFVGTTEALLESAAIPDATVRIVTGASSFARDLELEIMWRA